MTDIPHALGAKSKACRSHRTMPGRVRATGTRRGAIPAPLLSPGLPPAALRAGGLEGGAGFPGV
jgi:hypothetical protein